MPDIHAIHGLTALLKLGLLAVTMTVPSLLPEMSQAGGPPQMPQAPRMLVASPSSHPLVVQRFANDLVARAGEVHHMQLEVADPQAKDLHSLAASSEFAVLPLATYLRLRRQQRLELLGVSQTQRRLVMVGRPGSTTAQCGRTLVFDRREDPAFVTRVALREDFRDLAAAPSATPLRDVLTGAAACALVDQRQLASLAGNEDHIDVLWRTRQFPTAVVVASARVSATDRAVFRTELGQICQGRGEVLCQDAGIGGWTPLRRGGLRREVRAYESGA